MAVNTQTIERSAVGITAELHKITGNAPTGVQSVAERITIMRAGYEQRLAELARVSDERVAEVTAIVEQLRPQLQIANQELQLARQTIADLNRELNALRGTLALTNTAIDAAFTDPIRQ